MLVEIFVFYEIVAIGLFLLAFFTKHEIIWALSALFSGVLMFTSYDIGTYVYSYNATLVAYQPTLQSSSFPYLMGINLALFSLTVILGIFDMFDKYGKKFIEK